MKGLLRTRKQKTIMGIVLREAGEGRLHSIRSLHALMPYQCHYGSFRRSLEFLEKHGAIAKERTGMSVQIAPTVAAYEWFTPM